MLGQNCFKWISTVILVFYVFGVSSQDVNLFWGPVAKKPGKTDVSAIIGADDNCFYCIRRRTALIGNGETSIEKYSRNTLQLQLVRNFDVSGPNGEKLGVERILLLKNRIWVFSSGYNKNQDRNIAYLRLMKAQTLDWEGPLQEIDFINAEKKKNSGSFDIVLSADSSKILLMHNEPYVTYSNEKFSYKVFDESGSVLWKADVEMPYKDKSFQISKYVVDKHGDVFMLAKIALGKVTGPNKAPYKYNLIFYNHETKKINETEINVDDKFISDISFDINKNNEIVVGGFYSNKDATGIIGSFYISLNKFDRSVISAGYKDFPASFLAEFMSARSIKKQRELHGYNIDHFVVKSDGGAYMVAEQYYMQVSYTSSGMGYGMGYGGFGYGNSVVYNYYYNDIIVVNINPDASIQWVKKIPKYQHSQNDYGYYSSYSLNVVNDKLFFIYNDNVKNLSGKSNFVRNGIAGRKMVTVLATIEEDGTLKRNMMFDAKNSRIYTRPKVSMQLNPYESLFYGIRNRTYKFAKISYR